jgi:hypothetical protein
MRARDATRTRRDGATIQALGGGATAFATRLLEDQPVEVEQDAEKRDHRKRLLANRERGASSRPATRRRPPLSRPVVRFSASASAG